MSEEKFTPGPWVARIEDHSFCDTGDVFTSFTVATEGAGKYDCFAEVFARNDDIDEAAANTKLIAATPEMYEFGETTAEVLKILLERLGPQPAGLDAEIKRLAEERIAEWREIGKKARGGGMKKFRFIDLFCGGGGSITGAVNALRAAGEKYEGRGFNHWDTAIRTIQANHPEIVPDFARACAPIQSVLPDEVFDVDPERIDVLWASPSCTHHSNAAAGKPRSNQLRSQPEYLLPFLRMTKCRRMFVENVREILDWGPLLDNETVFRGKKYHAGNPDPRKKGTFFNLWLREIRASGYAVDMQIMNAADYGAATSRERLIVQAVRKSSGERIVWPEPTHTKEPGLLSASYLPWRSAADVIDWTLPGKSIFDRSKPLCKNTLRRIEAGIRKYTGPFLIEYYGQGGAVSMDIPLHTVTTRDRFGIVRGRTHQDITLRFLTAGELAAAMSFPPDYVFCGGDTAAKKQIGNAVPPVLAEALYRAVLAA